MWEKTTKTVRNRCQIMMNLDEAHGKILTHEQSIKINCVRMITVTNTMKFCSEKGIEDITSLNCNVNSDQARRKLDECAENQILIRCDVYGHQKNILVMNNFNAHKAASLYKAFPPAEARRII